MNSTKQINQTLETLNIRPLSVGICPDSIQNLTPRGKAQGQLTQKEGDLLSLIKCKKCHSNSVTFQKERNNKNGEVRGEVRKCIQMVRSGVRSESEVRNRVQKKKISTGILSLLQNAYTQFQRYYTHTIKTRVYTPFLLCVSRSVNKQCMHDIVVTKLKKGLSVLFNNDKKLKVILKGEAHKDIDKNKRISKIKRGNLI